MSDIPQNEYIKRRGKGSGMPLRGPESDFGSTDKGFSVQQDFGTYFGPTEVPVFAGHLQYDFDGTVWAQDEDSEFWYPVSAGATN